MEVSVKRAYVPHIRQRWRTDRRHADGDSKVKKQKHIAMKHTKLLILALAAVLSVGCNQEKAAIDETKDATKQAIDARKDEVNANAKDATKRTDANATIDKAQIEANKDSMQAQLDADKKKADAAAEAAKAKVDAENK
jgi:hypothetical protein